MSDTKIDLESFIDNMQNDLRQNIHKSIDLHIKDLRRDNPAVGWISDKGDDVEFISSDFFFDLSGDDHGNWNRFNLREAFNEFLATREYRTNTRLTDQSRSQYPSIIKLRQILVEAIEQIDGERDLIHDQG